MRGIQIVSDKKRLSDDLYSTARQGLCKMEESNETIAKITSSTRDIAEIIEIINSVASKTSLLSMNAAIEAGRACSPSKTQARGTKT